MVIKLSALLRILVDKMEQNQMLLIDNAAIFKHYMELIQLRSGLTFEIHTDIPLAKTYEDKKVPSILFLIPILESLFFGKQSIGGDQISSVSLETKLEKPASHGFLIKIDGVFQSEESAIYSESIAPLKNHHPFDFVHSVTEKCIRIGFTIKPYSAKKSSVYA